MVPRRQTSSPMDIRVFPAYLPCIYCYPYCLLVPERSNFNGILLILNSSHTNFVVRIVSEYHSMLLNILRHHNRKDRPIRRDIGFPHSSFRSPDWRNLHDSKLRRSLVFQNFQPMMQLLNTFSNMGGTWPKWFVLKGNHQTSSVLSKISLSPIGVDLLSEATCKVAGVGVDVSIQGTVSLLSSIYPPVYKSYSDRVCI